MSYYKTFMSVMAFIVLVFANNAMASWDSFLDDLSSTSKTLLVEDNSPATLDSETVIAGLKEALTIGSQQAIETVSQQNGYLNNNLIRIPLPPALQQVSGVIRQVGLSPLADQFEQSINHAAEKAAPEASQILINAIKTMSIEDATAILQGPDDAATQYFKKNTHEQLTTLFEPAITESLNQVGSTKYYNDLSKHVADVPVIGQTVNVDLPSYVTSQALNGLFVMLAREEQKIRANPTARTTELLKQVFEK